MKLIPLFKLESTYLVGLDIDHPEKPPLDSLVVEVDLLDKIITCEPWSRQKKLKFGFFYWIEPTDRKEIMDKINNSLGKNMIIEIQDSLLYPTNKSIESLIWIPDRLKNKNMP